MAKAQTNLTVKEKLSIRLLILAIKIIGPWEYSHEFTDLFKKIEEDLKEA